jgi:hypothetical protein
LQNCRPIQSYPGALPPALRGLSRVHAAGSAVNLSDWAQWWAFLKGADWRHPTDPRATSTLRQPPGRACHI